MKREWRDLSLFAVRVVLGVIFIYHGWPKLVDAPILLQLPSFVGYIVGVAEVLFGVLLILGVGFPWTLYPLMAVIAVALAFVQLPKGVTAGSERDLLILVVLFLLSTIGFGKHAVQKYKQ